MKEEWKISEIANRWEIVFSCKYNVIFFIMKMYKINTAKIGIAHKREGRFTLIGNATLSAHSSSVLFIGHMKIIGIHKGLARC